MRSNHRAAGKLSEGDARNSSFVFGNGTGQEEDKHVEVYDAKKRIIPWKRV
jgi:hypothetical protein